MVLTFVDTAVNTAYSDEAVSGKNIEEVLPLIRKYQEFYKTKASIDDEKNRA